MIANATGCSSVYASTFPFNPYNDPWVNSLFQDTPAVAKGLFEGLTASAVDDIKALRVAKLELADAYDAGLYDKAFRTLSWKDFTPDELALLPTVVSMGGDGATYDIGFGALSRLLATSTPVKVVVLNTGVYSNTGGQTSTASLTGQDSDLSRFGAAHPGKQEDRKELGLIAAFHPNVFVVQTSTAIQGHFLKSVMEYLNHSSSPAVLDVYTPCQAEHGIADAAAARRARLAVESRMSPVFVHDPRQTRPQEPLLARRQPGPRQGLDHHHPHLCRGWRDQADAGAADPGRLRPRRNALHEAVPQAQGRHQRGGDPRVRRAAAQRPRRQDGVRVGNRRQAAADQAGGVERHRPPRRGAPEVLADAALPRRPRDRRSSMPTTAPSSRRCSPATRQAMTEKESSLDTIARAMSELAASSDAPANGALASALSPFGGAAAPAAAASAPAASNGRVPALPFIHDEDVAKCTNCKTCYQQVSEIFEKTVIVADGGTKEVAHTIPGALDKVAVTPDLKTRVARVAANCDAEIIR